MLSFSSPSATGDVTFSPLFPSSCLSAPWPPTRPPAPTPTRPREWTWPTASPTCGLKPRSTAWTRCPRSTERRRGWGLAQEGRGPSPLLDPRGRTPSLGRAPSHIPWIMKSPLLSGAASTAHFYIYMQNVGHRVMAGFCLSRLFLLSWASLNSCLYKKTSRLDAVAEYLRSFTFVIVTEMEGEYFKDHFVFKQRTCSRRRLVYGLRGIPFVPLAVVVDKMTHQIWDQQHFFPLLKSTTNRQWLPLTFTPFFLKR